MEVGHNAIFEGPDGRDWLCSHYWLKGKQVTAIDPVMMVFADTCEQLGIEPIRFENGRWMVTGPTWVEQNIETP